MHNALHTPICGRLGIEYPIFLAGMGGAGFLVPLPGNWALEYTFAASDWNAGPSVWYLQWVNPCTPATAWTSRRSFAASRDPNDPGVTYRQVNAQNKLTFVFTYLNTDRVWSTNLPNGAGMGNAINQCTPSCDIRTVILHEMGHWVRYLHPLSAEDSVMWVNWTVKRTPSGHDNTSLLTIYG